MSEIVEKAKAFAADHVAPNAARWAREGRMQVEALRLAAGRGLLAFQAPKVWGGAEISFHDKLRLLETLSRHSYDFAFSLTNTAGVRKLINIHRGQHCFGLFGKTTHTR